MFTSDYCGGSGFVRALGVMASGIFCSAVVSRFVAGNSYKCMYPPALNFPPLVAKLARRSGSLE